MKTRSNTLKAISLMMLAFSSFNSFAAMISWNGNSIEALDLNSSYSSFQEFYDYDNTFQWSSNTGLELVDTIVMFVAELNGEFGIFSTISSPTGGSQGSVTFNYGASAGSMLFIDDPDENVNGTDVNFIYGQNKSDGFIYSRLGDFNWTFAPSFFNQSNIEGIRFVSFSGGEFANAQYSDLISLDEVLVVSNEINSSSASQPINAPGTFCLLLLGILGLTARRKL